MEDFGDDFGEIYAGIEEQANLAINRAPEFAQFYTELEEDKGGDKNKPKNASEESFVSDSKKPDSVCEELGEKVSALEVNEDYNGSDSEDDLKIVLNDEDCEGQIFPIAGRGSIKSDEHEIEDDDGFLASKEYKYVRTQGATYRSNGKANEAVSLVSSILVRGDHDSNMCYQHNGSSSQVTCVRDTPNSVVTQNRYGFRLPWYRTILDVNIESFEPKPWRYPGVDITDYFNFGFDEDSWKQYCNSLEQLQLAPMQFRFPVSDYSKFHQAKVAGYAYEKFTQEAIYKEMNHSEPTELAPPSRFSDSETRPIGTAIQIEDSIFERQPSFDSMHPCSLDSDVVLQISVQDFPEETSSSGEGRGHTISTAHEASENGEFNPNGNEIISTKEDDSTVGNPEGNERLYRCSQQISASQPITIDSDNYRNNQGVDLDEYGHMKVSAISSETIEIANKTKERVGRNALYADQCMMEAQISLGDDNQLSPTSSCFASDSETFKNVPFDPEDIRTPISSSVNSEAELCESVTSSFKNSKTNDIKKKLFDVKDYSTRKTSARKEHKHQGRRLHSVVERKIHTEDDNDASPTSETEDLYYRDSSLESQRRKKRLRDFGCSDRVDISKYKKSSHYGNTYADNHVHTDENRKVSHKILDEPDPHVRKTGNGREYFFEDRDTDWRRSERSEFTREWSPLPNRESRGWHSRYSFHNVDERDARSRRNGNKLKFKEIPDHIGGCFNHKRQDDFVGKKFGRRVSFNGRKRNAFDEFDQRQFPQIRREFKNSERRGGCVNSSLYDWDDSFPGKTEDEFYRHRKNEYLSDQSYRELYTADGGRWHDSLLPRNDASYLRTTDQRNWRHARTIYSAEAKESSWFDSSYDVDEIDDVIYPDDHFKWRRSNWRSKIVHWTEDQFTVRNHGDKLYSEKASCSYQKYVSSANVHAKYGSSRDAIHIDDMLSEQHGLNMMGKGSSANFIYRNSKIYKSKHEQTALCRDSIDLIVGEGNVKLGEAKSSVRCYKDRSLVGSGRKENMDPEIGDKRTTSDSTESKKFRAIQVITPKVGCNQNNEKGLDKSPVSSQNDDIDVEDGQIVTRDENTNPSHRKHASEYSASAHNVKKRMIYDEGATNGDKVIQGYQRILETMAKMEKRGERFKEPITLRKEPDKLPKPDIDLLVETPEVQQHRPARKRQWGGIKVV